MMRRRGRATTRYAKQVRHSASRHRKEDGVEPVRVALLGCGVVGTEVARNLTAHAPELAQRVGAPLELAVDAARFHYYDPATGERLEPSGTAVPELAAAR
jgi:hypothetical protein